MSLKLFVILCLCLISFSSAASASASVQNSRQRKQIPTWTWLFPGGGQFYLGQKKQAIGYAVGTLGLVGWGAAVEGRRGSGEINAPFVYAQQLYVTAAYAAYRDLRLRMGETNGPAPVDPASTYELATAPFRWENVKSPWVIGSLLAGVGLNYAISKYDSDRRKFGDIRRVNYLGSSFNRDQGLAVYSAYWIPISLGAGVSEETLFRGIFQSEWERRWGSTRGLWAASGLFGLAHLTQPSDPESWGNAAFATAAGLYLGWRYQRKGYRLSEPIAAHFWFDFAAGLTLFFANPEENPLGAKFDFSF